MSLDGLAIAALKDELNEKLINGRIDKIHQPEKDEIMLQIRLPGQTLRLLLSANAQKARIQVTKLQKANPYSPPMFCMVLRKHLEGGRIIKFSQPSLERIIQIEVENYDELGNLGRKILIGEFMGKHSNIILIDPENDKTILDGLKRYSYATSQYREVLPGRPYVTPPAQEKIDPQTILEDEDKFRQVFWQKAVDFSGSTEKLLLYTFQGLSPQTCGEIVIRANLQGLALENFGDYELHSLWSSLKEVLSGLSNSHWSPTLVKTTKGEALAFAPIDLLQYQGFTKQTGSISEVLEQFYGQKDTDDRVKQRKSVLQTVLSDNLNRLYKKLNIYRKDLIKVENKEDLKVNGELITANIYKISKGFEQIEVINYYDPEGKTKVISLNPHLTPAENAQHFFKKYSKAKSTLIMVSEQKDIVEKEISYLESVLTTIDLSNDLEAIAEIKEELISEGYLKKQPEKKKGNKPVSQKLQTKPLRFLTPDGFEILVGKNNRQNDILTQKIATQDDLWFHTKDIPGSHVIVRTTGKEMTEETIKLAAVLAAYHSRARESANVPVDFTFKKNVKKPKGAKPGMVIYVQQQTLYVNPDENIINEQLKLES